MSLPGIAVKWYLETICGVQEQFGCEAPACNWGGAWTFAGGEAGGLGCWGDECFVRFWVVRDGWGGVVFGFEVCWCRTVPSIWKWERRLSFSISSELRC